jgi:hypothetical protein
MTAFVVAREGAARIDLMDERCRARGTAGSGVRTAGGKAQRGNTVELGLLARVFLGLLARVVALVEHLDFLELFEGFA